MSLPRPTLVRWFIIGGVILIPCFVYLEHLKKRGYEDWVAAYFDLMAIGKGYRAYQEKYQRPPGKREDLEEFADVIRDPAMRRLREGRCVIFWNVALTDNNMKAKDQVLGFVKDRGNWGFDYDTPVLRGDGLVTTLSDRQLAALIAQQGE